jgi:hypothetical protein
VGADTVAAAAAVAESWRRIAVVGVASAEGSPLVVLEAGRVRPAAGTGRGCPRPAQSRWADADWSPDATAGRRGVAGSPAIAALLAWGHSSGQTGGVRRRSCWPALRTRRPCCGLTVRLRCGCGGTSSAPGRPEAVTEAGRSCVESGRGWATAAAGRVVAGSSGRPGRDGRSGG